MQHDATLFVDWLTVWQAHPEHGSLNSGAIITFDKSGSICFERMRSASIRGSFGTSCSLKSDGRSVIASGNFGRFGRSDNLFNYDPKETLQRANVLVERGGLPAFQLGYNRIDTSPNSVHGNSEPSTNEQKTNVFQITTNAKTSAEWLHLSRIDLTRNYSSGGIAQARAFIRNVARKSKVRAKRGIAGDDSVWWSNSRYMLKFYIKSIEMEAHGDTESKAYHYAKTNGIIRCELELKRRELFDLGFSEFNTFLKAWDMGTIHKLFDDITRPVMEIDAIKSPAAFLDTLPQKLQLVAIGYLSGHDIRAAMSKATFYRHRKALLQYGLDISDDAPATITTLVQTITLTAVSPPDWYQLEK